MRILVTGGAGYLGSVIVEELLRHKHEVTILDNLKFNQLSLLNYTTNKRFKFVYGDVTDKPLLKELCSGVDVVIPLAAVVGFPACSKDPELAERLNYQQIVDICEFTNGNAKILYPNTNSGYGVGESNQHCTEESPLNPISHYGVTKVKAEEFLRTYTDAICFRFATVFGSSPRMRMDLLVNEFVYKALTDKYIVVFEPHFKRNYIHVRDVARVFTYMIDRFDKHKGNVYNVGLSDANLSKLELLHKIKQYIPDFAINTSDYYEDPDKRDYVVLNDKVEATGWKPSYTIDDGIQELIKTYQMIVPRLSSEFRNGFPLGYANTL